MSDILIFLGCLIGAPLLIAFGYGYGLVMIHAASWVLG